MKKFIHLLISILMSCLLLSILYFMIGYSHGFASSSSNATEGAILVNTMEDELNNDGDCSLREAITAANTNTQSDACPAGEGVYTDTITFSLGGIITVTSQLSITAGGPLVIDGGDVITTSGGGTTRVWWVEEGSEVTLSHLAMVSGNSYEGGSLYNHIGVVYLVDGTFKENQASEGGAIYNFGTMHIIDSQFNQNDAPAVGGSIFNDGILTISSSSFSGNTSYFSCGAINTWKPLTITDSVFVNNSTDGDCGAICGGKVNITHSIFSGNTANTGGGLCLNEGTIFDSTFTGNSAQTGGGISGGSYGKGEIQIINSTISGNFAGVSGGGLYDEGKITISNSTISGNSSGDHGGGISISAAGFIPSTLLLANTTIADNNAPTGGGIYNNGNTTLSSSIIANNPGGDCVVNNGAVTDGGHNLDSDNTCGLHPANGSLPATDPLLGPLQDNGGATFTQALLAGSPAIDAGGSDLCPQLDQRGMYRPIDGNEDGTAACDIGSFEAGGSLLDVTTLEDELNTDGDCSLREAVEAANTNSPLDSCGAGNPLFDMITFEVAGSIVLTDPISITNSGELAIFGGDTVSLSGSGVTRVMWVDPGVKLQLMNLAIVDGYFSGNGSGIYNNGNLTIANSTFSGNNGSYGGAIYNSGLLTVSSSAFFENKASSGGGISNWGTLAITNSTFSGNHANDWAAGIDNWGNMTLLNSTIAENSVVNGAGAGIYVGVLGNTTLINTIVANNQGGDCFGNIIDSGHNLDSDGTCNFDLANGSLPDMDPLLGPLQNNGGSTSTQALLPNSPAIDAGDDAQCPATDQRTYPRPMDGNGDGIPVCDMGAYEDSLGHLLVNTLGDDMQADGHCSLREALEAANTNKLVFDCGQGDNLPDTIIFSVQGTIILTSQLTVLPGGPLIIDGKDTVTLSGGNAGRVWWVEPDGHLTIQRLRITDAFLWDESGGGLYNNFGTVVISNTKFLQNTAEAGGGAIYNLGIISITNSIFSESIASGSLGGAITSYGTITLTNSTISDNLAYLCGGFDNESVAFVDRSTFSGNTAYWGGAGLCNYGELTILNSTVSSNTISMGSGGCIYNTGTMGMTNGTVTANSSPSGGGIYGGSGVTLINTIVANNLSGDCAAPIHDISHNLDSDGSCGLNPANGSLSNTDPILGPLRDNGGPTLTHALLSGSPAIDAGDNDNCPPTDQRGFHRPADGNGDGMAVCDIGAYELMFLSQRIFLPIILH